MGLFDRIFGRKKPEDEEKAAEGKKTEIAGKPVEGTKTEIAGKSMEGKKTETVTEAGRSEYADKPLLKYEYHYGGNENGNSHSETVEAVDDAHARVSIEHADWHSEDPKVEEYLVDIGIMEALREIFCRYRMEEWHKREFSEEFVCDGETYGYHFTFEGSEIWFSSMVFPREYGEKLDELHEVFAKYVSEGKCLPGLVLKRPAEPEMYARIPEKGKIKLEVYEYCRGTLYYRLGNGTDEDIEWNEITLYRSGEKVPVVTVTERYPNHAPAHEFGEEILEVPGQLAEGKYRLEADAYKCEFTVE
ncbi:MAG: hypothetical protein IKI15_05755 [Lachnospiraceae bacterium]|nr:hypothetical protein [Lachnospiraceae bacterium]